MAFQEQPVPPIPTVVDVSSTEDDDDPDELNICKLEYGIATPGTMATTPTTPSTASTSLGFASPISVFASFAASSQVNLFNDKKTSLSDSATTITEATTAEHEEYDSDSVNFVNPLTRLGISKPLYSIDDDDEDNDLEERIGIDPPNYSVPKGDIPLSALNLFPEKKLKKSAPVLLENSDDDGEHLWHYKVTEQYPERIDEGDETEESSSSDEEGLDNVDRLLHNQTAEGHYLFNSRPVDAPIADLKYSLKNGKASMSRVQREFSKPRHLKTRPNIAKSERDFGIPKADASYKIFLLLLAPKSKIFEIIQVFYNPRQASVGHLLDLIPANATEPALASQSYIGLCRPNDGIHIKTETMVSSSNGNSLCARILKGEILVAIPHGYSSTCCAKLSKPILSNKRVTKLLGRNDPLSKIKKKRKKRRHSVQEENANDYKSIAVESSRRHHSTLENDIQYKSIAVETITQVSKSSSEEEQPALRTEKKENELLRRLLQSATDNNSHSSMDENGSGVPALMASNSISEDSGSCNTLSDDLNSLKGNNQKKIFVPRVEVWETNMSLKSEYSVASSALSTTTSVDLMLSRPRQQRSTSHLPTIPATPTRLQESVDYEMNNPLLIGNGMYLSPMYTKRGLSKTSNENRVRVACATIIQSAVRRVLTSNQTKKIYQRNLLPTFSNTGKGDFSCLHHVCAIIIQCHVRSLIAKNFIRTLRVLV